MWFWSCGSFETVMNLNWAGEATVSPAFSFNRAPYSQALAAWTQWSELSLYSDVNKLSGASRLTTTTTCLILSFHSHTNSFIHAVSQCYTATLAQWAWDKPYPRRYITWLWNSRVARVTSTPFANVFENKWSWAWSKLWPLFCNGCFISLLESSEFEFCLRLAKYFGGFYVRLQTSIVWFPFVFSRRDSPHNFSLTRLAHANTARW